MSGKRKPKPRRELPTHALPNGAAGPRGKSHDADARALRGAIERVGPPVVVDTFREGRAQQVPSVDWWNYVLLSTVEYPLLLTAAMSERLDALEAAGEGPVAGLNSELDAVVEALRTLREHVGRRAEARAIHARRQALLQALWALWQRSPRYARERERP